MSCAAESSGWNEDRQVRGPYETDFGAGFLSSELAELGGQLMPSEQGMGIAVMLSNVTFERLNGSLVSMEKGTAIPYSIDKLQDRGKFFVDPGEDIYEGQVIGENSRQDDMTVNITKTKKLSNVRSSGADDKAKIVPAIKFSLEEALEYIQKDEYVEVTPKTMRIRKIYLKETDRKRFGKQIG